MGDVKRFLHQGHPSHPLVEVVLASDHEREVAALKERYQEALRALYFWLPHVPADESPYADRVAADSMLLTGLEGDETEIDAEQRGWIQRCTSNQSVSQSDDS